MNEIVDNFAWTRQLECPPTIYNDSVKKTLCKGILELLWEDISNSTYSLTEACKIRKNILLHKLKHEINDPVISSVRHLHQLKFKSSALKQQASAMEEDYEEQDYIVRQKKQQLKNIRSKCSIISTRKDFLKLKHIDTSKLQKDCDNMRQVCQHLMPNTSKDLDQQKLRENLNLVANLRHSSADRKQIWKKVLSSLGGINVHTLWTHLYQALSQDLNTLMKLETKKNFTSLNVGENLDLGIARVCGQYIYMTSKRILSDTKATIYEQRIIEYMNLIESLAHEDINAWLVLKLEVKKIETEQAYLQNEVQEMKNIIQENSLLNLDIARLTTEIETIDAQIEKYVKDIQQSIAVLNCTSTLVAKQKEKLHCELPRIVALQTDFHDVKCINNAMDIELDIFYNVLDLNALRKIMLKGNIGLYRHAACGLDTAFIASVNPQYLRLKPYFPIIQMPIYFFMHCYGNVIANTIYTKLYCLPSTEDIECTNKLIPSQEKCNYNSLELLNLATVVCDQARQEIELFNMVLSAW
ncbi:hypothetical protein PUN28_006853 [Cardiocondyla obscurior]